MSVDSKKRKHDASGSAASGIWQSIRSRLFLPGILSSAEPTSNTAEASAPNANDCLPQEKEETNAAKQRKLCQNDKVEDAGVFSASASMITPEKSACGGKSSKPAQDGLIPRVTEQMDLADLKVEAWEQGYAAPDDSTKSDLLAYLHVGSICISSIKRMARQELLELEPGSAERHEQEAAAGAVFLQHGLGYYNLNEMFGNLAFTSKNAREHCMRSLEADCKKRYPALLDGIARSKSSDKGGKLTYGRAIRFTMPVEAIAGKPWDYLEEAGVNCHFASSDERYAPFAQHVDVLIQIEDGQGNVLAHAAVPLGEGDDLEPNLFASVRVPPFQFDVPIPPPDHEFEEYEEDTSDEYKALAAYAPGQGCVDCGNPSCRNFSPTLAARVIFRHRESGKMAIVMTCPRFNVIEDESETGKGSYIVYFDNRFQFLDDLLMMPRSMETGLFVRVYSEERKDSADRIKFSTRPFSHSPSNDPTIPNVPSSVLKGERSNDSTELSFSIWNDVNCHRTLMQGLSTQLLWC